MLPFNILHFSTVSKVSLEHSTKLPQKLRVHKAVVFSAEVLPIARSKILVEGFLRAYRYKDPFSS